MPRTSFLTVTVVGLRGIGRQVAVQLAALGVWQLQLADSGSVSYSSQTLDGYAHDDIGRPRVHAAAEQCHRIDPRLDVRVIQSRTLPSDALVTDAVICCAATWREYLAARRKHSGQHPLFVAAYADREQIYITGVVERGGRGRHQSQGATLTDGPSAGDAPTENDTGTGTTGKIKSKTMPVPSHVACIAAGLVVHEYAMFARGAGYSRELHLDLRSLKLSVHT